MLSKNGKTHQRKRLLGRRGVWHFVAFVLFRFSRGFLVFARHKRWWSMHIYYKLHVFSNLSCFWFGKMKLVRNFLYRLHGTKGMGPSMRTTYLHLNIYIVTSTSLPAMNSWFYSSKLGKFICKYTISIHFHGSVHALQFHTTEVQLSPVAGESHQHTNMNKGRIEILYLFRCIQCCPSQYEYISDL